MFIDDERAGSSKQSSELGGSQTGPRRWMLAFEQTQPCAGLSSGPVPYSSRMSSPAPYEKTELSRPASHAQERGDGPSSRLTPSSSRKRSVKPNLSHSPTVRFNVGVRSQSARAAWLARVRCTTAARLPDHAFASGLRTISQGVGVLPLPSRSSGVGILDDIEASLSSPQRREPSF